MESFDLEQALSSHKRVLSGSKLGALEIPNWLLVGSEIDSLRMFSHTHISGRIWPVNSVTAS